MQLFTAEAARQTRTKERAAPRAGGGLTSSTLAVSWLHLDRSVHLEHRAVSADRIRGAAAAAAAAAVPFSCHARPARRAPGGRTDARGWRTQIVRPIESRRRPEADSRRATGRPDAVDR